MNFKLIILTTTALTIISLASSKSVEKKRQDDSLGSLALQTVLAVIAPVAIGGFTELFSGFFKPNMEKQQIILGRPMKVKVCSDSEFCIQITDEYTGIVSTGNGQSYQEALGSATKDIYEELLQDGQLSLYDLCELHMRFPHPDQDNCSNIEINPCDLLSPVVTTPKPCEDHLQGRYCTTNKSRCNNPTFSNYMLINCFKTCTDGLCGMSADPCKLQ